MLQRNAERTFVYLHSALTGQVISSWAKSCGLRYGMKHIEVAFECEDEDVEFEGDTIKVKGEVVGYLSEG